MKIKQSNWPKSPIQWIKNRTLYISIPFTWNLPEIKAELKYKSPLYWDQVIIGGPAVYLMPNYFDELDYVKIGPYQEGVLQKTNPMATKTTIGCIRKCKFCGVPKFEGKFKELENWPDLPIICDNNLFASSQKHFDKVIDRLIKWRYADFNQGLDSRLLDNYHAERLSQIKKPMIRLALDSMNYSDSFLIAYERLRKFKIAKSKIRTYALIGFNSDPAEAWTRCEWIEKHTSKSSVLPMWFHSLKSLKRNQVSKEQKELGWNDYERTKIMGWVYWRRKPK